MSTNSYIYNYRYHNNDIMLKSYTKFAIVLVVILVLLMLFFLINPVNMINEWVNAKNEELNRKNKTIVCSDGTTITYASDYPKPTSGVISADYGNLIKPINNEEYNHNGIDIAGKIYESVRTIENGVVTKAINNGVSEHGNSIEIKHTTENGVFYSFYGNLSEINVSVGETLKQGDIIGKNGGEPKEHFTPGVMYSKEFHFEIRTASGGNQIDPRPYIF